LTQGQKGDINNSRELTKGWVEFIDLCEEMGYGKIQEVIIRDGEPVYASIAKHDIKFG